jgi:hypothetical protein
MVNFHMPYLERVDLSRYILAEQMSEEKFTLAVRSTIDNLDRYFRLNLPMPSLAKTCDPVTAAEVLHRAHNLLCTRIENVISKYPASMWLWYSRRLPTHVFLGELATTQGYDSTLMDICTGIWGHSRVMREFTPDSSIVYSLELPVIHEVMALCAHIILLSDIHSYLRYAGKGVDFEYTFDLFKSIPTPKPTPIQKQTIQLYDKL